MLSKIFGRLRCQFGHHSRSRKHARLDGQFYVSRCTYCGITMRQIGSGEWQVDTGQPYEKNSGRFLDMD